MSVHNRPTAWNYLRSRGFSDYVFQTCSIGFTPELMYVKTMFCEQFHLSDGDIQVNSINTFMKHVIWMCYNQICEEIY